MDIRGCFNGGKKKKGKDVSSEKKRPTEEGTSARPLTPKRKFLHTPCVMLDWFKRSKSKSSQ